MKNILICKENEIYNNVKLVEGNEYIFIGKECFGRDYILKNMVDDKMIKIDIHDIHRLFIPKETVKTCSICGKNLYQVNMMVWGIKGCICDKCTELAMKMLLEEKYK